MNTIKRFPLMFITLILILGFTVSANAQEDEYVLSQAELDQILAPIALYPDTVLSHILIAATYPLEVIEADRWAQKNPGVSGNKALDAVENKSWDPSVKALSAFPQILNKMSEDLQWMQTLGDAFLQDEELVLISVQQLRKRANDNGALNDLDHMKVVKDDGNIVIESRVKEIVYVPYYDTRIVYGPWWWNNYPPVYWSGVHTGISFYWGPRVRVGTGIYFSSFHWNRRHVVVVDRRLHRRHRFYTGRHVVSHSSAKRWSHNPSHRRGVHYRTPSVRTRYTNIRNASRTSDNRNHLRNERRIVNGNQKRTSRNVTERLRQERPSSIHQRTTDKRKERFRETNRSQQSRYSTEKRGTLRSETRQPNASKRTQTQNNQQTVKLSDSTQKETNTSRYRSNRENEYNKRTTNRDKKSREQLERTNKKTSTNFRSSNTASRNTRESRVRTERSTRLTSPNRSSRNSESRASRSQRSDLRSIKEI